MMPRAPITPMDKDEPQYNVLKIPTICAAVAVPMPIMGTVKAT